MYALQHWMNVHMGSVQDMKKYLKSIIVMKGRPLRDHVVNAE